MTPVEAVLHELARAGAPSVVAPPQLAQRVLASRTRTSRFRRGAAVLLAGGLLLGGVTAARSGAERRYFELYQPGTSMMPTVVPGERLVVDRSLTPLRTDVVVVEGPDDTRFTARGQRFPLRVIGLAGDEVACPAPPGGSCTSWTVNGKALDESYLQGASTDPYGPVVVPAGELFLLGDNRDGAVDSRLVGTLPAAAVSGVAVQVRGDSGRRPIAGAPAHDVPSSDRVEPDDVVPPAPAGPAE